MSKPVSVVLVMIAGILLSQPAFAETYYVDSVAGSDSSSGLSDAAPWKTLQKVNTSTFTAGSTVLLKRGSKWRESLIVPSSGLTIDAYGAGALPILDSSIPVTGWTSQGFSIWQSPVISLSPLGTGGLGNLTENGAMMPLRQWTASALLTLLAAPAGSYTYDFVGNRLYIKSSSNPNTNGKSYLASTLLFGVTAQNKSDIRVSHLNITRFSLHGIQFASCLRCEARDSTISNGGGAVVVPPSLYAGNGLEWSGNSADGVADGMVISNVLDSGISPQTFNANANQISNIVIRNSSVDRTGFAGVEISALSNSGPGASISGVTISDLTITNAGRGWGGNRYGNQANGIRVVADQGAGTISGVTVSRTTISNAVGNGLNIENDVGTVTLERLRVSGNQYGVRAFANSGNSPTLKLVLLASIVDRNRADGVFYDAPSSSGLRMVHNTFYRNGTRNLQIRGQSNLADVRNNVFAGTGSMAQLYVDNFVNSRRILNGATVDGNCYSTSQGMIYYDNVTYSTMAAFRNATGFEMQGAEGTPLLLLNPTGLSLVNPDAGDFRLGGSSPCIDNGVTGVDVLTDFNGNPYHTQPSSGALEQGS